MSIENGKKIHNQNSKISKAKSNSDDHDDYIKITYDINTKKKKKVYTDIENDQIKEIKHLIEKIIQPNVHDYSGNVRKCGNSSTSVTKSESYHDKMKVKRTETLKLSTSASLNLKSTRNLHNKKIIRLPPILATNISSTGEKVSIQPPFCDIVKSTTAKHSISGSENEKEVFSPSTILKTIDKLNISSDSGQLKKMSIKNKYDPYELSKFSFQQSSELFTDSSARSEFDAQLNGNQSPDLNLPLIKDFYLNKITSYSQDYTSDEASKMNSFIVYETSQKTSGNSQGLSRLRELNKYNLKNFSYNTNGIINHDRTAAISNNLVNMKKKNVNDYELMSIKTETESMKEAKKYKPSSKISKVSGKLYMDIYIPSF